MSKRTLCSLGILLIVSASSVKAQEARCESLESKNAQSECYFGELKQAEAEMQRVYEHALSQYDPNQKEDSAQPPLPKLDQKMQRDSLRHVVQKLQDSQQLWLDYREKACGAIEDKYKGGTIVGEVVPLCKIDLTKQRTKFLRDNFGK